MRALLCLLALVSLPVFAQGGQAAPLGDRCYGRDCSVKKLTTNRAAGSVHICESIPGGVSYAWLATGSANSLYSYAAASCTGGPAERFGWATSYGLYSTSTVMGAAGTAANPTFSWIGDTNTGIYSVGADQLGVATAGVRSFSFSATAGTLEGTSANASISLTANASVSTTGVVSLNGASGVTIQTGALTPVTFGASAQTLYADSNTNRLWLQRTTARSDTPPYDLGGAAHAVMQGRTYVLDVGVESSSAPSWSPTPRVGASSVTMTVVDAAVAGATTLGAAPNVVDVRTSVTTAAAGSTSTVIASAAYVRRDHGPRWCQVVAVDAKTTVRLWLGLSTALPGSSDTPAATDFIALRSSSDAADPNWMVCSKDGATQSCTDTTASVSVGTTAPQVVCLDCREAGACTVWIDGVARVRKTTNLPTLTTKLAPFWSVEARAAAARTLYAGPATVELR